MQLIRNHSVDGKCKYALLRLDKMRVQNPTLYAELSAGNPTFSTAADLLPFLEWGEKHSKEEFFVVKLKDCNAGHALEQYANAAYSSGDADLGRDVMELSERARAHPGAHKPD